MGGLSFAIPTTVKAAAVARGWRVSRCSTRPTRRATDQALVCTPAAPGWFDRRKEGALTTSKYSEGDPFPTDISQQAAPSSYAEQLFIHKQTADNHIVFLG